MMKRLVVLLLLILAAATVCIRADAQQGSNTAPQGQQVSKPAAAPASAAAKTAAATTAAAAAAAAEPARASKSLVPLKARDFFLLALTFWIITIAAGGGIGGGTLLVPLLAILSDFTMLEIVALSNLTILAGTVTNILFNLPRKHPSGTGPVIYYDLLMLFGPMIMAGSVMGSHLNYFIPGYVTKILVMLLMLPMAWRTMAKARLAWADETRRRRQQAAKADAAGGSLLHSQSGASMSDPSFHRACSSAAAVEAALLRRGRDGDAVGEGAAGTAGTSAAGAADLDPAQPDAAAGSSGSGGGGCDLRRHPSPGRNKDAGGQLPQAGVSHCRRLNHDACVHTWELDRRMEDVMEHHASAQYPWRHLVALAATMLVVVVMSLTAQFLVKCGTVQYWLLTMSPIPIMCLIWALIRWHVLWCEGWRKCLVLEHHGEVDWTPRNTVVYPAFCTIIGLLGGLLGLGGGTFMTPILLELGVHPSVAAASAQAATSFGTFTSSVVYLVNRTVPFDYGLVMVIMGLTGALHGQLVINYLIGRTNRPSIVVMTLAGLFIIAFAAATAVAGMALADVAKNPYKLRLTNVANVCRHRS